jgi:prefoldin subunit 5
MTKNKEPVLSIDDKEYSMDDLDESQKYLVLQMQEVSASIRSLNLKIAQYQAALTTFRGMLNKSLEESDD